MKNLQVLGTQDFMGIEIPVIEGGFGEGKKCILAKTISEIHDTRSNDIQDLINTHLDEFEIGVDLLDLKVTDSNGYNLEDLGLTKMQIAKSKNIYLLSEQGYMLLVGFMNTQKAKEIRKQLRREYFTMRQQLTTKLDSYMIEDPIARAKRWIEEQEEKQLLENKVEEMQPRIDYLEKIQGYGVKITTSQIAVDYGMSATAFNKLLKELHIQYKQGGVWYLYQNYKGKGYEVMSTYNGHLTRYWTPQGAEWLYHILKEYGYVPVVESNLEIK